MISWLISIFDGMNRNMDVKHLWPSLKDSAPGVEIAKFAFVFHLYRDPSWNKYFSVDEIFNFVEGLE